MNIKHYYDVIRDRMESKRMTSAMDLIAEHNNILGMLSNSVNNKELCPEDGLELARYCGSLLNDMIQLKGVLK